MSTTAGLDRLVYMANQIATFFEAQPGGLAAKQTADHLKNFWEPRMRRAIIAHLDAGGDGLSSVASAAVELLRTASRGAIAADLARQGKRTALAPGDDAG